ncbi:hypothetical protein MP638_002684, partial [Amoeboaphelidium occidentale]
METRFALIKQELTSESSGKATKKDTDYFVFREKRAKDNAAGAGKSQLKQNQQALNIICKICRQAYMLTASTKILEEHAQ